jgi:20S proteasome alpha/beta subunit
MTRKSSWKLQNRLIQLSDTTAVCLSGVVSDSLALLAKVYELQEQ